MARQLKQSLRQRANDAAEKIVVNGRLTIEAVHECGLILLEAKHQIPHGEFLEWLQDGGFAHGGRQARKYMQVAKSDLRDILDCTSIAEAVRIASPKAEKAPEKRQSDDSKRHSSADLPDPKPPVEQPKPADDFADLEPAKAIATKPQAMDLDPIQQAAEFLMTLPNIGVAAKCLLESLNKQSEDRQKMFREIWNLVEEAE